MQLEKLTIDMEGAIDRATVTVMEVHKKIARVPFDLAAQLQPIADRARKAHETQERVLDVVYDSIRKVNHAFFDGLTSIVHAATPATPSVVTAAETPATAASDPAPRRKKSVESTVKV